MQTKMSLSTAGIYCTISPLLSGAVEDCSVVCVPQLQCSLTKDCMFASQRMFSSLWNVVVTHEHRWQDDSRWLGTTAKCQKTTDERAWQPWSQCAGIPVASVADRAPALCGLNIEYHKPVMWWRSTHVWLCVCVQTDSIHCILPQRTHRPRTDHQRSLDCLQIWWKGRCLLCLDGWLMSITLLCCVHANCRSQIWF